MSTSIPGTASRQALLASMYSSRGRGREQAADALFTLAATDPDVLQGVTVGLASASAKPLERGCKLLNRLLRMETDGDRVRQALAAALALKPKLKVLTRLGEVLARRCDEDWMPGLLHAIAQMTPKSQAQRLLVTTIGACKPKDSASAVALLPVIIQALQRHRRAGAQTRATLIRALRRLDDGRSWATLFVEAATPPKPYSSDTVERLWWREVLDAAELPPQAAPWLRELAGWPPIRRWVLGKIRAEEADRGWLTGLLADPEPLVRAAAGVALHGLSPAPDLLAALLRQLDESGILDERLFDPDWELSAWIERFRALALDGDAAAAPPLQPLPGVTERLVYPSSEVWCQAVSWFIINGDPEGQHAVLIARSRNLHYALERRTTDFSMSLPLKFPVTLSTPSDPLNATDIQGDLRSQRGVIRAARLCAAAGAGDLQVLPPILSALPTESNPEVYDIAAAEVLPQAWILPEARLAELLRIEQEALEALSPR